MGNFMEITASPFKLTTKDWIFIVVMVLVCVFMTFSVRDLLNASSPVPKNELLKAAQDDLCVKESINAWLSSDFVVTESALRQIGRICADDTAIMEQRAALESLLNDTEGHK
jgi:hypothetical protein